MEVDVDSVTAERNCALKGYGGVDEDQVLVGAHLLVHSELKPQQVYCASVDP
jgi:hypothetical protein